MESAFMQAILDSPAEDDTWQVLADWLEDQGQPDRAELVRLQVQLRSRLPLRRRSRLEKRAQQLLASRVKPAVSTITNSQGMRLALIPPGWFLMGSRSSRPGDAIDEGPRHWVEITCAFYLGIHHVTQEQYRRMMGHNPSYFGSEGVGKSLVGHLDARKLPVESVSFDDVTEFCHRLSQRPAERKAGRIYRLPTEAEWEYACRAGMAQTAYHFGSRLRTEIARFNGNDGSHPLPVGSLAPNLFGLYDMHGNVWEWCADWYDEDYYTHAPEQNPSGPTNGNRRVLRGGGWSTPASLCRSAIRGNNTEDARHNYNGFRVALSIRQS